MSRVISVSASAQVWVRPCSSVWLCSVNGVFVDVGGGALAPGQGVEPGRVQVGEQRRRPAAAVEPDQHPAVVADGGAQLGDQPAQLGGQGGGRLGHHHQQRIPGRIGHPGFHRGRGGELQPGHMGFGDLAGARIGAHMPVDVEHRRLLGAGGHMPGGHRGDPVAGLAGLGEQPDLAADRLDLRGPVQPQHPAQRGRVDPGRALRAGLAQQGAEHPLAQHRIQRVEPVGQLTVDGVRGVQQPGARQRGQPQQQPRQRRPRTPGEHRRCRRDQPEPRQRPFGAAVDRIGQHRHHSLRRTSASVGDRRSRHRCRAILPGSHLGARLAFDLDLRFRPEMSIQTCWGARLLGVGVPERVADAAHRHAGGGGDPAVGRPARAQPANGGNGVGGEFRLAFGALAFGEQAGDTVVGEPGLPAPHRGRPHRERLGDLQLGGRLNPHQRHRRQPAPRGVAGIPRVDQVAVHEHPAAIGVLDDRRGRTDRARVLGRQRQRRLRGHHGHRPPLPESHEITISIIDHRDRGHTDDTPEIRRSQHRITDRTQAPCQES